MRPLNSNTRPAKCKYIISLRFKLQLGSDTLVSVTSIYDKFQTVIPAEIRNEFDLDKSYKIEWRINDNGKVELEFIKELTLEDMVGRYTASQPIDSAKLKKDFKNGKL